MGNITKLTGIWYQIVGLDHHKDRDCHFSIKKKWSYGNEPTYQIEHSGYVAGDNYDEFSTYKEAEAGLEKFLRQIIKDQEEWANRVLSGKENWQEEHKENANSILKIIKEGLTE